MKQVKVMLAVAFLLFLGACTSLGLQQATSPSQGIAYGYSQVAAVRSSAATALASGTLSVADAQKVLTETDNARALLDSAQAATASGNTTGAAGYLSSATLALTTLQTYLQTKGVK